ncbi:MAG: hypothetical protein WDN04_20130 [Rhodospirillales bacterium]
MHTVGVFRRHLLHVDADRRVQLALDRSVQRHQYIVFGVIVIMQVAAADAQGLCYFGGGGLGDSVAIESSVAAASMSAARPPGVSGAVAGASSMPIG